MPAAALIDPIDPRNPAPPPGSPRPPLLKALVSIRFFFALYVALYHLVRPFSLWGPFAGFMAAGYVGVCFFFLLSGYILTYTHATEAATGPRFRRRFLFARFARVYPLYLLSMIVAALLSLHLFSKPAHIVAFAADLLMVQSWSIRMVNFFSIPAWSLSCEAFFYVVFPWVYLRLRPASRQQGWLWFAALWAVAMIAPLVTLFATPAAAWHEGIGGLWVFWVRRFPPLLVPQFLAGIPLAWIYLRHRPSVRTAAWLATVGAAGLIASACLSPHLPFVILSNGLLLPFCAMLVLGISENTWLTRLLSGRVLMLLGEASYALYLFHFLWNDLLNDHFGAGSTIASACWKLAIFIPLSVALHLWVERPCRKRLMQWWNSRERTG